MHAKEHEKISQGSRTWRPLDKQSLVAIASSIRLPGFGMHPPRFNSTQHSWIDSVQAVRVAPDFQNTYKHTGAYSDTSAYLHLSTISMYQPHPRATTDEAQDTQSGQGKNDTGSGRFWGISDCTAPLSTTYINRQLNIATSKFTYLHRLPLIPALHSCRREKRKPPFCTQ